MNILVGDKNIDMRNIIDLKDKGYYFYIETSEGTFTFIGEEAKIVRETLQALHREQKAENQPSLNHINPVIHINHIELIGIVEWDPELSHTPQGIPKCSFLIRTDVNIKESIASLWHTVITVDDLAEYCSLEIKGGFIVKIEGFISSDVYFDETEKPHIETFVNAVSAQIL